MTTDHATAELERNKAVVRRTFEELLNRGRFDEVKELYAPNLVYHASNGEELHGRERIRELVTLYRQAFPDITATVEDLIAEGDRVVVRFTARGTHTGEAHGVARTGRELRMAGLILCRLAGGRIVEEWEGISREAMLEQVGAPPAR